MTTKQLAAENRRRLICAMLAEQCHTHATIARLVGCHRSYVQQIASQMRKAGTLPEPPA